MKFDSALLDPNPGGVSLLARSSTFKDDEDDANAEDFAKLIGASMADDEGDDD